MTNRSKFRRRSDEDRQAFICRVKREGTRDELILAIIDELEDFVKYEIGKYNRIMVAEYEDLMSDFYLAVCAHVDEYDPEKNSPSAYFAMFINNEHRAEALKKGIPQYYLTKGTKLDKVARQEGYGDGINDPDLSDMTLALLANESLTTVKATRKIFSQTTCSFDEVINVEDPLHMTPEQIAVKEESEQALADAVNSLPPFEKWLFITVNSDKDEGGMPLKNIVGKLQKDYKKFGLKTPPTQLSLKRTLAIIQRKLLGNNVLRDIYYNVKDDDEDLVMTDFYETLNENLDLLD